LSQDDRLLGVVGGAAIKVPVRAASTANLTLSGTQTVDGVALVADDRVLVKDQTTNTENGIYVVDTGAWSRAADFDGPLDAVFGTLVRVNSGTTLSGTFWYVSSATPVTFGTDVITFGASSSVLATLSVFTQTLTPLTTAAAWRTALGVPSTTEAILQTIGTTKGDIIGFSAASTSVRKGVGTDGYALAANSGDTDGLRYLPPGVGFALINGYLDWTVAGNALTCTLKGLDGNAPSSTNPVYAWIRSATATSGLPALAKITSATSASLSSGSTAGTRNAVPCNIWAVLFNDAGTYRIGLINCLTTVAGAGFGSTVTAVYPLGQFPVATSVAEGGGGAADSAQTIYAATLVSAKGYTVLGYAYFAAGQATAGTWATAPTRQHLHIAGNPLPGQEIQKVRNDTGAVATGGTQIPADDTIPQISEGDQYMTQAITPSSAANVLRVRARSMLIQSGAGVVSAALFQDATLNALFAYQDDTLSATGFANATFDALMLAATVAATTLRMRAGPGSAVTVGFNGTSGGTRRFGGVSHSFMEVQEIQA
jgi:hypothetical protein